MDSSLIHLDLQLRRQCSCADACEVLLEPLFRHQLAQLHCHSDQLLQESTQELE